MLKNNVLSLMMHIIIGFIASILFQFADNLLWTYEINQILFKVASFLLFAITIFSYVLIGRQLEIVGSKIRNFFSVSGVTIIGISLWIQCFCLSNGVSIGNDLTWPPYVYFERYSFPLMSIFNIYDPSLTLIFTIIPSLFLYMGMQINIKNKIASDVENIVLNQDEGLKKKEAVRRRNIVIGIVSLFAVIIVFEVYSICSKQMIIKPIPGPSFAKPVIYLYPEKITDVNLKIKIDGDLFVTYPKCDLEKGWRVEARPDGKLINKIDGKEYSYLFWEGMDNASNYRMDKGFVVEGEKTAEFLQDSLSKMGLTPKEYNEFIVYWLPNMIKNKFNLIYFAGEDYTRKAQLEVYPKPDSVLRVFMVFKKLDKKIKIEEQKLKPFERKGFSLIEWGGTEIK